MTGDRADLPGLLADAQRAARFIRLLAPHVGNIRVESSSELNALLARAQAEAGMELLLVPSCTEAEHGYWRVRHGAQARALEGQCYAVHAPTVGMAEWSPAVDLNRGAAGIYTPPDGPFPPSGLLVAGEMDAPQWLFGAIDLDHVAALRADGGVLNMRDWAEQPGGGSLPPVEVVDLR